MPSETFLLYNWKILHHLSWLSFVNQGHFSFQVFVNFRKFLSHWRCFMLPNWVWGLCDSLASSLHLLFWLSSIVPCLLDRSLCGNHFCACEPVWASDQSEIIGGVIVQFWLAPLSLSRNAGVTWQRKRQREARTGVGVWVEGKGKETFFPNPFMFWRSLRLSRRNLSNDTLGAEALRSS